MLWFAFSFTVQTEEFDDEKFPDFAVFDNNSHRFLCGKHANVEKK